MTEFDPFKEEPREPAEEGFEPLQPLDKIMLDNVFPEPATVRDLPMGDEAVILGAHPREVPASRGGWLYPGRPSPPPGTVVFEGKEWPIRRNCSWSEDQYVAREVEITKAQMRTGKLKEVIDPREGPGKGKGRVWRTEQYARWRYRGFLAGEIEGL